MQTLRKVALIGNGAGAFGLVDGLNRQQAVKVRLDHYIPSISLPVHFQSGVHSGALPLGGRFGAMSLWGGILAFSGLQEYLSAPIWNVLKRPAANTVGKPGKKILVRCNTKEVLAEFVAAKATFSEQNSYTPTFTGIASLRETQRGIRLYDYSGIELGPTYDAVILCAGAIQTPRILAGSNLIEPSFKIRDNSMSMLAQPYSQLLTEGYDYSNDAPQCVATIYNDRISSHFVSVKKHYRINCPDIFAQTYWGGSGKSIKEKALVALTVVGPSLFTKKTSLSIDPLETILRVDDAAAAQIDVKISSKRTLIARHPVNPASVSAFHFHDSVTEGAECYLQNRGIFIADASAVRDLNGLNPFARTFARGSLIASVFSKND